MSKTETLRQLTSASNVRHVAHMSAQLETLRQAKVQSTEELAALLEPLAQAMAALTDETRAALTDLQAQSAQQVAEMQRQSRAARKVWEQSTQRMDETERRLRQATERLGWRHYVLTVLMGLLAAVLTLGLWTWLSAKPASGTQPSRPSVTAPRKPSSGSSKPLG
jgi:CHASE3 domain sensor protein